MKQFIRITIALVMGVIALGLQSCGSSEKSNNAEDSVAVEIGIAMDESGNIVVPYDGNEKEARGVSAWKYESLTDEFGDDNGERVITGIFDGKFSNSATNNSDAKLQIFYTEGTPLFRVFDYGNQLVKGDSYLRFKVKDGNGNVNVLYLLNNDGFFVPTDIPGTLGMVGIDSLLRAEQNIKLSGVLLDGHSDVDCLTTEFGYLSEETGSAHGYIERTEANKPKYHFAVKPKGLNDMIKK